jgi:hypothetical protein
MRRDQPRINLQRAALILVAGIVVTSCSEKSALEGASEANPSQMPREPVHGSEVQSPQGTAALPPPSEGRIGRDCVAFVRSTKAIPAQATPRPDCPDCPAEGAEVLSVRQLKTDAVSCSGDTCHVTVTVRAVFDPARGETITGGLTPWISPEQRTAYLSGRAPTDEQVYRVLITYKQREGGWRAIDYDRAPAE